MTTATAPPLVIRGATVLDGTGSDGFTADVRLAGGRIEAVGDVGPVPPGVTELDATGRVLCPGFIDIHTHADLSVPAFPSADGWVRQGVTTLVTGNCGYSPFPLLPATRAAYRENRRMADAGIAWDWDDLAGFAASVGRLPLSVNLAPLVGHGTVRFAVLGDADVQPDDAQLDTMRSLVRTAMEQGAHGISSGLIYRPGIYATTDELVALAEEAATFGGFYASHIRGEDDTLSDAVAEILQIGERAGIGVQISHHKSKRRRNWGRTRQTLPVIAAAAHAAAAAGDRTVRIDCYPYTASSTTIWSYFPDEMRLPALLAGEPLTDDQRAAIIAVIERDYPDDPRYGCDLADLVISAVGRPCRFADYSGLSLPEAATREGLDLPHFVLELLHAAGDVQIIDHALDEADVARVLADPLCLVGSDARPAHPDIPGAPHPRNFGTFPRFLRRYVLDGGLMSLAEGVHRCTGLPAARLGWTDRGLLHPGAAADLLLFDPRTVTDNATFAEPKQFPTGIDRVIVGGHTVYADGRQPTVHAGRVLLRDNG